MRLPSLVETAIQEASERTDMEARHIVGTCAASIGCRVVLPVQAFLLRSCWKNPGGRVSDTFEIKDAELEEYKVYLQEPSRPPSQGGNKKAKHLHVLTVNGARYSFFAFGRPQWAHKGDRLSFQYEVNGPHRNILLDTFQTVNSKRQPVVRGVRDFTKKERTVATRLPARRRERLD